MQEAFKKVEKDAFRFAGENEKLKKTIESMQEELETLRKDASVMRSILDRAAISATPAAPAQEKPKYVPKPFAKKEEDQISAFDNVPDEPVAKAAAPVAEEPAVEIESKKTSGKNRVGNMFDLLTFSDV